METPPFLMTTSSPSLILRTVDSMPKLHAPPSRIKTSESLWKSAYTCSALVGETCPNLFADGAAIGRPDSSSSYLATGCYGILIPMKPVLAVIIMGILSRFAGVTNVSGPGQ